MPHSLPLDSRRVLSVSCAPRSELPAPVDPLYADNCFLKKKRLHCRYGSQRCQILILALTNVSSVELELRRFRKQILHTVGVERKIDSSIHLFLNNSCLQLLQCLCMRYINDLHACTIAETLPKSCCEEPINSQHYCKHTSFTSRFSRATTVLSCFALITISVYVLR